ncbi:MAG: hypothetical protein F6K26_21230 [Moorea sp. SIO2I5]|nr:hypothetical protein [Moorena sp. SIO2I5]
MRVQTNPCLDAKREWGKPRQSASGGNPQDRAASPRPRCIAVTSYFRPVLGKLEASGCELQSVGILTTVPIARAIVWF